MVVEVPVEVVPVVDDVAAIEVVSVVDVVAAMAKFKTSCKSASLRPVITGKESHVVNIHRDTRL